MIRDFFKFSIFVIPSLKPCQFVNSYRKFKKAQSTTMWHCTLKKYYLLGFIANTKKADCNTKPLLLW